MSLRPHDTSTLGRECTIRHGGESADRTVAALATAQPIFAVQQMYRYKVRPLVYPHAHNSENILVVSPAKDGYTHRLVLDGAHAHAWKWKRLIGTNDHLENMAASSWWLHHITPGWLPDRFAPHPPSESARLPAVLHHADDQGAWGASQALQVRQPVVWVAAPMAACWLH